MSSSSSPPLSHVYHISQIIEPGGAVIAIAVIVVMVVVVTVVVVGVVGSLAAHRGYKSALLHCDSGRRCRNVFRTSTSGRIRRRPRRLRRRVLLSNWGWVRRRRWWLESPHPPSTQQHRPQTSKAKVLNNRPDGHLHRISAFRPQRIPASWLVLVLMLVMMLLLLPLDDHLLQLGLLQHIRQLIVVIKVNHGMLRKKIRRKSILYYLNEEPRTDESQIAVLTIEPIVIKTPCICNTSGSFIFSHRVTLLSWRAVNGIPVVSLRIPRPAMDPFSSFFFHTSCQTVMHSCSRQLSRPMPFRDRTMAAYGIVLISNPDDQYDVKRRSARQLKPLAVVGVMNCGRGKGWSNRLCFTAGFCDWYGRLGTPSDLTEDISSRATSITGIPNRVLALGDKRKNPYSKEYSTMRYKWNNTHTLVERNCAESSCALDCKACGERANRPGGGASNSENRNRFTAVCDRSDRQTI
ncbi:hypothetical protein AGLY_009882 [Aphis glycines]|uniref:Uncharacterized protein n=1 Tax=Aphis glycines TaxID=307491 RepID=A0A6G0TH70_APHGL|nr:hypothetical protein AGLY_009882 [Aphis glycines]